MTITNTVVTSELSSLNDGYNLTYNSTNKTWDTTAILPDYWRLIPRPNYSATPASSSTITTYVDYSHIIKSGYPIRVFDRDGYIRGTGSYIVGSLRNVTGLTTDCVDESGRIYITVTTDGGGNYAIYLYKDSAKSSDSEIAACLLYTATGDQPLSESNSSGVSGTINIITLGASSNIYADMYMWQVISSINTTTITTASATLNDGYPTINYLWYGSPTRVQQLQYTIPGNYAAAATTTLLADSGMYSRWQGSDCRLSAISYIVDQISLTPPTVSFFSDGDDITDGYGAITSAGTWINVDVTNQIKTSYLSDFEIETTLGDATDDSDLTILISAILE